MDEEEKRDFDEFYAMYPTESLEVEKTDEIILTATVSEWSPGTPTEFTTIITVQIGTEKTLIRLIEDKPFTIQLKKV